MSRLIAILAGIIVLLIAVIVAVPMLVPSSVYKERVVSLVKEQTGRDLIIGGDVSLSFFPQLAVKVEDVSLSNAPWAKDKDMASMKELRAAIKIMPLFKGAVEIDSFVLVDPVIHLEVKSDGTPNWQFSSATAAPSDTPAATDTSSSSGSSSSLNQIRLGEVAITNGTATYRNAQTGQSLAFEAVNLNLSLPGLDQPFNADGGLTWNSEPLKLTLTAQRPRALTQGGPTPVEFSLSSSKIRASYKGSFQAFDKMAFIGGVDLDIPSVRTLAAWLGSPLPAGKGFNALTIHGEAKGSDNNYQFKNAKLSFDGMNATGNVTVSTAGQRPRVKGNLDLDRVDANVYMSDASAATPATSSSSSGASGAGNSGWSTTPIDLSGLKAIDAAISITTKELLVKAIKIGASAINLTLNNGVLNVDLNKLALYKGAGSGSLILNGATRTPQLNAAFKISGVEAEPLLTDAADFKRLSGMSAISFAVTATGRNQREMISTLNGNGDLKFTNGAIKGINLASLMRNVFTAPTTGWTSGGTQDTDFSELGGTFTIAKGILTNKDLKLQSPLIRVAGSGTVDLPAQTLNYRVEPKLAATLEGQGGADAKGIEVPVIISGPWAKPSFRPDLASMLQNREQTIDTIKSLKDGGGKALLNNLLGGGAQSDSPSTDKTTPPANDNKKVDPADALKSLFGK